MMEYLPLIVFLVMFAGMFVLRMPIPTGMIVACALYFITDGLCKGHDFIGMITGQQGQLHLIAQKTIEAIFTNGTIIAVPLFVFAANLMNTSTVTDYIFGFCEGLVGRFHGGMAHVNILNSLVFSGMTGSAIADATGMGALEIEVMKKQGYEPEFACAMTAASATIGPIFPPSIPMVVYSMLTGASVGALFMGGMVPGVMLALFLCIYIAIVAKKRNYPRSNAIKLREYLKFLVKAIWALLTPVILLGCVYTGITTPTEAGAVAGLYTIIISIFLYKTLGWKDLKKILYDTVKGTGGVTIMIGAASTISFIFAKEGLGVAIGNWLLSVAGTKVAFLILVNIVVLLLGMFVDTSVIQLIMIPILWPVAQKLGIDVVHFGLIFTFNTMLGLSTPPFGMLLFITSSTSGTPLKKIIKEIMWPIIVMLIELVLITFVPDVVLFLPKLFGMM